MVTFFELAEQVSQLARAEEAHRMELLEHASQLDDLLERLNRVELQISELMARQRQPDTSAEESTAARGSQPGNSAKRCRLTRQPSTDDEAIRKQTAEAIADDV